MLVRLFGYIEVVQSFGVEGLSGWFRLLAPLLHGVKQYLVLQGFKVLLYGFKVLLTEIYDQITLRLHPVSNPKP